MSAIRYSSTAPSPGDDNWTLLAKIVQAQNDSRGGNHPPASGDNYNDLLRKWAALLSNS